MSTQEDAGRAVSSRSDKDAWMLTAIGMDMSSPPDTASSPDALAKDGTVPGGPSSGDGGVLVALESPKGLPPKVKLKAKVPAPILATSSKAVRFQASVNDGATQVAYRGKIGPIKTVQDELAKGLDRHMTAIRNSWHAMESIINDIEKSSHSFFTRAAAFAELEDLNTFCAEYRQLLNKAGSHVMNAGLAVKDSQPIVFEREAIEAARMLTSIDRGARDVEQAITKGAEELASLCEHIKDGCNYALTILSVVAPVGVLGKVIAGSVEEVEKQAAGRVDGKPFDLSRLVTKIAWEFLVAEFGNVMNASAEEAIASHVQPALLKLLGDPKRVKIAIIAARVSAFSVLQKSVEAALEKMLPHEREEVKKGKGRPKFVFCKAVLVEAMKGFSEEMFNLAREAKA